MHLGIRTARCREPHADADVHRRRRARAEQRAEPSRRTVHVHLEPVPRRSVAEHPGELARRGDGVACRALAADHDDAIRELLPATLPATGERAPALTDQGEAERRYLITASTRR